MSPTTNITLNDFHVILNGIEWLTIILAVVLAVTLLLNKKDIIPVLYRKFVVVLVGFWILAVVFQYVISTYNYVHAIRPLQKEAQRQSLGL